MSLIERVEKDYITAYKEKNKLKLDVLRLLKSAAKNLQVDLMRALTEDDFVTVLQKQAKQRKDSIEQFEAAKRHDLAEKEAAELAILKEYLPEPLMEEELDLVIRNKIRELEVTDLSGMGKVIQGVMSDYKGRVDGKSVSSSVKSILQSMS